MQTDWEWDWTTRRSWKSSWKDCFLFKTLKKNTIPNWKESTKSQVYQSITGTIYRASVTSVKWDVCTEPRLKDNTHPATVCSPCCRLTTDTQVPAARPPPPAASLPRRYDSCISLCCRIANESRKIVFFFFFSFTSYKLLLSYFKSGFNELPAASVSKLHVGAVPTDIMSSEFAALLSLTNTI